MGLGIAAVKLNLELWQRGFFRNLKSVVEMGSQELHLTQADFEGLLRTASVPNYRKDHFPHLETWPAQPRCSSKPLYELLGVERYSCIDLNGEQGAVQLDLNVPLEDVSRYAQCDLVTDYGNNEHVFNVAEAYRTMHRLCTEHGIMIIEQAVHGGNGYFTFDLSFFEGIAAANRYKILFSSYVITGQTKTRTGSVDQFHIPASRELLSAVDWAKVAHVSICYVFQKQSGVDFQYPYQGHYLSEVQGHDGFELQFLPTPPSRTYVPVRSSLEAIPAKTLLRCLIRKVAKRLLGHNRVKG